MSEKCLQCGKDLVHTPGRRKKEFCDSTCRSNYWNKTKKTNNLKFKVLPGPTSIPIAPKSDLENNKIEITIKKKSEPTNTRPDNWATLSRSEQLKWMKNNS